MKKITFILFNIYLIFIVDINNAQAVELICAENTDINIAQLEADVSQINLSFDRYINKLSLQESVVDFREKEFIKIYQICIKNKVYPLTLKSFNTTELKKLYSLLSSIFLFTYNKELVTSMSHIINEMRIRNVTVNYFLKQQYDFYIIARMFTAAEKLKQKNAKIITKKSLKIIAKQAYSKSILHITNTESLALLPFSLPKSGYVIIVGSLNCSPSKRFFQWLSDHKKYKDIFKNNATVLIPQFESPNIIQYKNFTEYPVGFVFQQKEWPSIQYWATPSFYFYKNGVLLSYFDGWPKQGRENRLLNSLKNIGL